MWWDLNIIYTCTPSHGFRRSPVGARTPVGIRYWPYNVRIMVVAGTRHCCHCPWGVHPWPEIGIECRVLSFFGLSPRAPLKSSGVFAYQPPLFVHKLCVLICRVDRPLPITRGRPSPQNQCLWLPRVLTGFFVDTPFNRKSGCATARMATCRWLLWEVVYITHTRRRNIYWLAEDSIFFLPMPRNLEILACLNPSVLRIIILHRNRL